LVLQVVQVPLVAVVQLLPHPALVLMLLSQVPLLGQSLLLVQ
jgi:hypothetical protein